MIGIVRTDNVRTIVTVKHVISSTLLTNGAFLSSIITDLVLT